MADGAGKFKPGPDPRRWKGGRAAKSTEAWRSWCRNLAIRKRSEVEKLATDPNFFRFLIEQGHGRATEHIDHTSNGETMTWTPAQIREVADEMEALEKASAGKDTILEE
jgi:hypothetical protein